MKRMRRIFFYFFILRKVMLLNIYPLFQRKGRFCRLMRLDIENFLIFQPSRLRAKRIKSGLLKKIKPQRFLNSDNIKLYAWYIPPKKGGKVILHFHGQAESILSHQDVALFCLKNGLGLYMLSYRGHYKSGGTASEKGIYRDAQDAMEQLKSKKIKQSNIILWGHSLGSAVAIETALHNNVAGVILQSPIKDINSAAIDVSRFYFKRLHLNILALIAKYQIKNLKFISKMNNIEKISKLTCPILLLHSKTDNIAPFKNSIDLAEKNSNCQVFISEHGNHWDVHWCFESL